MVEELWHLLLSSAILALFSAPTVSAVAIGNQTEDQILLFKTVEILRKTLNFFNREYRNVNLDAIIGTRIVEGQLKVLLQRIAHNPYAWSVDDYMLQDLNGLRDLAKDISDKAIPFAEASDPAYYKKIGALLAAGFWELNYPSRDFTGMETYWPYQPGETIREEDSDNCLAEFFGTGSFSEQKCRISSKCWKAMTQPGYNGYSLSHQVFYLQIGEQFGCLESMEWQRLIHRQPSLNKLSATFCFNMFREASLIYLNGFPEGRQDLFMEQAALCGMLGYREFFESNWLHAILSWYDEEKGCYTGLTIRESEVEYRKPTPKLERVIVKREERPLANGCLCHRSTVAAGALVNYVRYILEWESVARLK